MPEGGVQEMGTSISNSEGRPEGRERDAQQRDHDLWGQHETLTRQKKRRLEGGECRTVVRVR